MVSCIFDPLPVFHVCRRCGAAARWQRFRACCKSTASSLAVLQKMLRHPLGRSWTRAASAPRWRRDVLRFNGKLFKGAGADRWLQSAAHPHANRPAELTPRAPTGARWSLPFFGTLLDQCPGPHRAPRPGRRTNTPRAYGRAPGAAHRHRAAARPMGRTPSLPPWCWRTKPPRCKAKPPRPSLAEARALR